MLKLRFCRLAHRVRGAVRRGQHQDEAQPQVEAQDEAEAGDGAQQAQLQAGQSVGRLRDGRGCSANLCTLHISHPIHQQIGHHGEELLAARAQALSVG